MPVASYKQGPHRIGPKAIQAPKEASLRAWWNECRKVFPDLPLWNGPELFGQVTYADSEVIHFSWGMHDIYIARKRRLR